MFNLKEITTKLSADQILDKLTECYDLCVKDNPGFLRILDDSALLKTSIDRAKEVQKDFDHLVVLGIGGSSLGAKAIIQAFDCKDKVTFFENLDSYAFHRSFSKLKDIKKTHWVAISKSGNTLETLTQVQFVHEFYEKQNLDLKKQMTVITEKKKNPLFDWAMQNNIPVLEVPLDVGGRFSVLTPVGMFPAAFAGLNVEKIIAGAKTASKAQSQLFEFSHQMIESFEKQKWITVFWIYSESLKTFGLWFQQLWAESLAKKVTYDSKPAPRVSTPIMMLGSNDQHSMLQQIIEGEKDKFVIFLRSAREENSGGKLGKVLFPQFEFFKNAHMGNFFKAQAIGTQKALKKEGVESLTIYLEKFDEAEMGALFLYFEMVTAMLGKYHNIDTYNQPGVELSKKLTLDHLKV